MMQRRESEELESIRDWCLAVLEFKMTHGYAHAGLEDGLETLQREMAAQGRHIGKQWALALRGFYSMLQQEIQHWPESMRAEFGAFLASRPSALPANVVPDYEAVAKQILKRGAILSDEEFHIVKDRVDELCQSDSNVVEIDMFNRLLLAYELGK
jgi:hypothetical protein